VLQTWEKLLPWRKSYLSLCHELLNVDFHAGNSVFFRPLLYEGLSEKGHTFSSTGEREKRPRTQFELHTLLERVMEIP
jgi:hypothetical protein